jgi:hypothetical protein
MLQTKTWLSEIINGLLEGLGSFNNTIHPNENRTKDLQELLNKQRELIEQQETQNWRNRLKEDYKKENIKFSKLSLLQDILYVIIYNILNLSILHALTISWNIIKMELQMIICLLYYPPLENTMLEIILNL